MDDITHISVGPGDDADPQAPPKAVYVEPPAADVLDAEPFVSGRHRIERTPAHRRHAARDHAVVVVRTRRLSQAGPGRTSAATKIVRIKSRRDDTAR